LLGKQTSGARICQRACPNKSQPTSACKQTTHMSEPPDIGGSYSKRM
jgi:hypothetical protein